MTKGPGDEVGKKCQKPHDYSYVLSITCYLLPVGVTTSGRFADNISTVLCCKFKVQESYYETFGNKMPKD